MKYTLKLVETIQIKPLGKNTQLTKSLSIALDRTSPALNNFVTLDSLGEL